MTQPLVIQLRFARNELMRALEGVSDEEARRRFEPMNCISWMVGHRLISSGFSCGTGSQG
jgi:hypothetical protein